MNEVLNFIYKNTSHALTGVFIFFLLVIYSYLSKRVKKLPAIPLGLFIFYIILRIATNYLGYLGLAVWHKWIDITAVAALYCAVLKLLFYVIVENFVKWWKRKIIPPITRDFILFAFYVIIVLVLLRTRGGVNLAGLITTSAILTAAIGLGAQKTLGNLFSGLTLQINKPYQLGDWIEFNGHIGEVKEISWEITKMRTRKNEMVCIPNQQVTSIALKNFSSSGHKYLATFDVGISYETPPDEMKRVVVNLLMKEKKILLDPPPVVLLKDFADHSIIYTVRFALSDYRYESLILSDIRRKLWYALKRNGIQIPFPVRTIQYKHIEDKIVLERESQLKELSQSVLRKIPLFAPLRDDEIEELARNIKLVEFGEGEAIVKQGETGASMYVLEEGGVDVILEIDGGTEQKLASLADGAFFGEMSLLTGEPRSATVVANQRSLLLEIDKAAFTKIIDSDPSISEGLAALLVDRLAQLSKTKEDEEELSKKRGQILNKIKCFFGVV